MNSLVMRIALSAFSVKLKFSHLSIIQTSRRSMTSNPTWSDSRSRGSHHRQEHLRSTGSGPREGHCASRPKTGECEDDAGRQSQSARLWPGEGIGHWCFEYDALQFADHRERKLERHDCRYRCVHVAGTSKRS